MMPIHDTCSKSIKVIEFVNRSVVYGGIVINSVSPGVTVTMRFQEGCDVLPSSISIECHL